MLHANRARRHHSATGPLGALRRVAFTLVELLIVVVVLGILVALVIPKVQRARGMANSASIRSDLHNLARSQESYFAEHGSYTANVDSLGLLLSPGVSVTVRATTFGWSAVGTHPLAYPITCALFWGQITPDPPATTEGQVRCQ
jgi:prepilin-type N-terminal cleavage/methylation domain-containing protein